ncbi:MAG: hypothetical protein ABW321_32145 [Polyangiales bacterium]
MRGRQSLWLAAWTLTGCFAGAHSSQVQPDGRIYELEMHCARETMDQFSLYRMPLADPVQDESDARPLEVLPHTARRTARAAGLEPLLTDLLRVAPAASSGEPHLSRRSETQELTLRLVAFDSQLAALIFETECTRRRVAELVTELDTHEAERQLSLATGSLVIGAGTSISAGAWDLLGPPSTLPAVLALAGGIVTAALGTAALLVPQRAVTLEHHHTLLRPVFEGTDPAHLYPSFVFRMLTVRYPGDPSTPRELLLRDFQHMLDQHVPVHEHEHARSVLFGEGGVYSRSLLETRAVMLQALQAAVHGVARDLELFNRSLVRLLTWPLYETRLPRSRHPLARAMTR